MPMSSRSSVKDDSCAGAFGQHLEQHRPVDVLRDDSGSWAQSSAGDVDGFVTVLARVQPVSRCGSDSKGDAHWRQQEGRSRSFGTGFSVRDFKWSRP